ncbi:helix-turn-helix transcriptional regulator [Cellulomonas sp. NPDC055163]
MTSPGPLGSFLQARRAALTPQDAGLRTYGERRRVTGLRREEVALLAGVGMSYYTRLEQGQALHASAEVLDAVATALCLDDAERRHVHDLSAAPGRRAGRARVTPERVTPETEQLLAAVGDTPAILLGRRSDVLAWNRTGHAFFAAHVPVDAPRGPAADRPNMTRMVFLDAHTRDLYRDWPAKARAVVGHLRLQVGRHPDDPLLARLVGGLSIESPEFAAMWAAHRVRDCDVVELGMRHPLVGELTVVQQTLAVPQAPEQRLVLATAGAGTADAAALQLLAQAVGPEPRTRVVRDRVGPEAAAAR